MDEPTHKEETPAKADGTDQQPLTAEQIDAHYSKALEAGDTAFKQKNWDLASASYGYASQLKPNEKYPKDQITDVNNKAQLEIDKYQQQRIAYLKKQIPLVEIEAKYIRLLTEIDENRVRRIEAQMRHAQLTKAQPTLEQIEDMKRKAETAKGEGKLEGKVMNINNSNGTGGTEKTPNTFTNQTEEGPDK